jgi:hypothetical protein
VSRDVILRCNVTGRCRSNGLTAVQTAGYGVASCSAHLPKARTAAARRAKKVERETGTAPQVKEWRLAYFEDPATVEQLELPLEKK